MKSAADEVITHPQAGGRAMAALVLGGAKPSARVVRLLRRALEDEDFDVRDSAAASLAELGDTASIPSLMRLLDSTPPGFGRSIAWGLERLARDAGQERRAEIVEGLERYRRRARGSSREHADVLIRRLRSLDVSGTDQDLSAAWRMVEAQVQEPYQLQGVTFHGPDSEPRWVAFTYSERLGSFGAEGGGSTPSEALDELLRVLRIDRR